MDILGDRRLVKLLSGTKLRSFSEWNGTASQSESLSVFPKCQSGKRRSKIRDKTYKNIFLSLSPYLFLLA